MYEKINGQSQNKWMSGVTDYDYENEVKVWLRSIQISIMKWSLKKGQGLESRFLVRKTWRSLHNTYVKFKRYSVKSLGHNEWWMDEDG